MRWDVGCGNQSPDVSVGFVFQLEFDPKIRVRCG